MSIPKISIIVPVYNVEQYLPKCIESILGQTFTDFELLLIDDGTPDQSGIICDEYAKKDTRISVFHKKNGGVSSARNLGLDEARGEWVAFVDSDDFVGEKYLEDLYAGIIKDKIGFVMQGLSICDETGKVFNLKEFERGIIELNQFDLVFAEYDIIKCGFPVSKLYQLEIIRNNNVCFVEQIHMGEDMIFMLEYLQYCNYIFFIQGSNYNYLRTEKETLSSRYNNYDSEIYCYHRFYALLMRCKELFNLKESTLIHCYPYLCFYLFRSINAMYRPNNYILRVKRLEILNNLTEIDLYLIENYGFKELLVQKIQIKLLLKKLYIIFDISNCFLYYMRYKFQKIWFKIRLFYFKKIITND